MCVCVSNDVNGFVGVGPRRNYGTTDTTGSTLMVKGVCAVHGVLTGFGEGSAG